MKKKKLYVHYKNDMLLQENILNKDKCFLFFASFVLNNEEMCKNGLNNI